MISIVITTYGASEWEDLAWSRAYPSTIEQGAQEVIVHHERDLTIGPARNAAGRRAQGDYLLHLDADDELADGYVAAMEQAIREHPNPKMTLFQPSVSYIRKGRGTPPLVMPDKDIRTDNFLIIGTVVNRKLAQSVGGFPDYEHGFEDWGIWARCWRAGARVQQVPDAVYRAFWNPRSKHHTQWRDRKWQVATHLRVQAELFPEGV